VHVGQYSNVQAPEYGRQLIDNRLGTHTHTHTHIHTYNRFTAFFDFVRDYPGEPTLER